MGDNADRIAAGLVTEYRRGASVDAIASRIRLMVEYVEFQSMLTLSVSVGEARAALAHALREPGAEPKREMTRDEEAQHLRELRRSEPQAEPSAIPPDGDARLEAEHEARLAKAVAAQAEAGRLDALREPGAEQKIPSSDPDKPCRVCGKPLRDCNGHWHWDDGVGTNESASDLCWLASILVWLWEEQHQPHLFYDQWYAVDIILDIDDEKVTRFNGDTPLEAALSAAEQIVGGMHYREPSALDKAAADAEMGIQQQEPNRETMRSL